MKAKLKEQFGGVWVDVEIGLFGKCEYYGDPFVILKYNLDKVLICSTGLDRWYYTDPNKVFCVFDEVDEGVETEIALRRMK